MFSLRVPYILITKTCICNLHKWYITIRCLTRRNATTFPGGTMTPTQGLQRCYQESTKTPVYCEEEGLEAHQQRYINVHGQCRLPRAHAEQKDSYACDVPINKHLERKDSEQFPQHPHGPKQLREFRNCQKSQYVLVRIPPHCSVKWTHRSYFNSEFARHHEKYTWKENRTKVRVDSFNLEAYID